ncbi:hypothetical protein GCM10009541_04840 [Micromonospora gifhornensis]|uniref:AB hydrolase-1 domain-containing protein n=1 Tax=Micromonospora gifhornensis TaxID=84594 RepID=A0ABQ4IMD5_9ACTN|nr:MULTISPECIES: alpha/beta fold hydrolase [Micromonospora]PMR58105.1 alpha/beta hydrolase [Verrucosispora sp. ts21]GIJ19088.1 hypothetical protein Vgi01_57720 [Micromonospora gifhornensis]
MSIPARFRHLTVDGRRVHHRVDGAGPPVLLLHGIGRTLRDFTEQHDLLADRYRVHSVDLPGHGGSLPMAQPYTLPALARFVGAYLDAAGVDEPVHLVGNSLGGAVAMGYAVTRPTRVASLTLVASAGFGREVTLALRLLTLPGLGRLLLRPSRHTAGRAERALFHDPTLASPERIGHALAVARHPYAARVVLETARGLGTVRGIRQPWRDDLLGRLAGLGLPTLVVWGDDDRILPPAHLAAARTLLPHARTRVFAGCGHLPQVERAEEFSEVVREFWATTPGWRQHQQDDARRHQQDDPRP